MIQAIALCVVVAAALGAAAASSVVLGRGATAVLLAASVLGAFVVTSGYFMVFEIIWNGQTPGKRVLGVRVIRESGYPLRPVDSVVRNVVRIVDWLPFFYGIGVLVMLFNGRSRRLGDFAAGTIVVREGARRTLSTVGSIAGQSLPALAPDPPRNRRDPLGRTLRRTAKACGNNV